MSSMLEINGAIASPLNVRTPILTVTGRRSVLVPPEASLPLHDIAWSPANRVLWYRGRAGVALQHVGMLVGRKAHQSLWPGILRWIAECAGTSFSRASAPKSPKETGTGSTLVFSAPLWKYSMISPEKLSLPSGRFLGY